MKITLRMNKLTITYDNLTMLRRYTNNFKKNLND